MLYFPIQPVSVANLYNKCILTNFLLNCETADIQVYNIISKRGLRIGSGNIYRLFPTKLPPSRNTYLVVKSH